MGAVASAVLRTPCVVTDERLAQRLPLLDELVLRLEAERVCVAEIDGASLTRMEADHSPPRRARRLWPLQQAAMCSR